MPSPKLATLARARGHLEASHLNWIGKSGWKDWNLRTVILDGDGTFVTCNSVDFRGPANRPGSSGQYRVIALHAGLICLSRPVGMGLDQQLELFAAALDDLEHDGDLVNRVLEVAFLETTDEIVVARYALPSTP